MKTTKRAHRRLLSIDPGLGGTGWALWKEGTLESVGIVHNRAKDEALAVRCEEIAERLNNAVGWSSMDVYLEMPQHMSNAKGIAAQAGSVYKLAFLVGYIARSLRPATIHVVQPQEWKGQLPKDIVQRRVERILGMKKCRAVGIRSHAWDAVGIGLWAQGRL